MLRGNILWAAVMSLLTYACAYENNFDMNKGKRYLDFSFLAYCSDPKFSKTSTIDDWSCKNCKKYPNVNATTFDGGVVTDAKGFVAYDSDEGEIIVSFSGTDPTSIRNWIDDIQTWKVEYPYCTDCSVHKGFYSTFNSVKDQVISLVKEYKNSHPSATITVTGHSLGAAMAAHGMAELTQQGMKLTSAYTYGMPRVGDEKFQEWYSANVIGTYRVTHHRDPVPHLPTSSMGFKHMPYEAFYVHDSKDMQYCNFDGEDKSCSDQYKADVNVLDHASYMDVEFTDTYLSKGCEF